MLKQLRDKKTARKIWIVLAVIIVPAFVLWGSGSLMRDSRKEEFAGILFGRKVSLDEFRAALLATRNQLVMQYGRQAAQAFPEMNLETAAWERILLLGEARKRSLRVSDKEVIEALVKIPFFHDTEGFNEKIYQEVLRYDLHLQPREFEEQLRQTLMIAKLFEKVTAQISLSDDEVYSEYRKANEAVTVTYAASLNADAEKEVTADEAALKEYFQANAAAFKIPLSFNLEYAEKSSEGMPDEALRRLSQDMSARLRKKEPFEQIAAANGMQVKETGIFSENDPIPGIGWSPQLAMLIFKAKPGDFLPVVNSEKSLYLIRVKERKEPYIPDFEQARDKVREAFIKERSRELAKKKAETFQKTATGDTFEKTAKSHGLTTATTEPFVFGTYLEGIGASDTFWALGQSLKEGELSPLVPTVTGFYVLKLKSKKPLDEQQYAKDKAEFRAKTLALKKQETFEKFVNELKEKASRY